MIISTDPTRVVITLDNFDINLHSQIDRVYLKQSGRKMANKSGGREHEESDGEEDGGADTDEVSINVSKRKFSTLSGMN